MLLTLCKQMVRSMAIALLAYIHDAYTVLPITCRGTSDVHCYHDPRDSATIFLQKEILHATLSVVLRRANLILTGDQK